jgi:hypothetical protein
VWILQVINQFVHAEIYEVKRGRSVCSGLFGDLGPALGLLMLSRPDGSDAVTRRVKSCFDLLLCMFRVVDVMDWTGLFQELRGLWGTERRDVSCGVLSTVVPLLFARHQMSTRA